MVVRYVCVTITDLPWKMQAESRAGRGDRLLLLNLLRDAVSVCACVEACAIFTYTGKHTNQLPIHFVGRRRWVLYLHWEAMRSHVSCNTVVVVRGDLCANNNRRSDAS
jgi:hypothetical protein